MRDSRDVYELILESLLLEAPITLKAILSNKQPKLYNAAKKAYEKLMLSNMTDDPTQLKLIEDPQAEEEGLLNPELLAFKRKVFEISPTGDGFDFIFKMIARDDFESNADNIRQLTQLVDMGVRSVSFKKNITFLNELIQKMLMKQDQINQKDKSQTFYKKFDPSMSIFSKIENYYDLYENLKKYYEAGNDNLISAFIKIKTSDNLKEFLLASDLESAEISPVGVFSEIRNKNLMPDAKKFSEKLKETDKLTGRSFAGYYVPFINYCLDNKIWAELITEKSNKNIKLFLIRNYNAMVCANNFYPKAFLSTCTDDVVKSITGTTKSKTQHSSGVSEDYVPIGGNQVEIMGLMDSTANWCVKAEEYYSNYATAAEGITFLLVLDNTCKKVYLMRLQTIDDQTKLFDEPMDYYDRPTKSESFSPELRTIWIDMFGGDDEAERLYKRVTGSKEGTLTRQGLGTITALNEIPVDFYFDDQYLKINYEQKNLQIFNEVFANNSNKIKNDLKNLENINIASIFEYILNFINENILDNDNIRLFGILLKNDELGVNINVFNLMAFIALDNESKEFFKKLIFDTLIGSGLNPDLELIKLMINERNVLQILNLIKKTQNIFNDRMKIELVQSLTNENLLKIIDELYFSGFFKNDINTIKKYFEINTTEKINNFKSNISDQIFKALLTESENFKTENLLTEMLGNIRIISSDNPNEFYKKEIQQDFIKLMPDIFFEKLNNQIAINDDSLLKIETDEFLTNLEKDLRTIKTDSNLQNLEKDLNQFMPFLDNILKLRQQLETDYGSNIEKAAKNYDRHMMYIDRAADYGNYKIEGTDLFGIDKAYVGFYKNTTNSLDNKNYNNVINCFQKLKEQNPLMNIQNMQIKLKNLCILKNCYKFSEQLRTNSNNFNRNIINGKTLSYLKTITIRELDYEINNLENLNNIINIIQKFKESIEMYKYNFIYTADFSTFNQIIVMNKNNDNYYTKLFDLIYRVMEEISRLKFIKEFDTSSFNEILKGDHYEDKIENPNIRDSMSQIIANFQRKINQANEREAAKKQQEDDKNKPGFFQRMMKKWFLEGIQYQRINQNKILISETELKKLIRKNIL